MDVFQVNSRMISDIPGLDTERTERSPLMTPTASSSGRVTKFSTSAGAASG